jgi:hypothetical protein
MILRRSGVPGGLEKYQRVVITLPYKAQFDLHWCGRLTNKLLKKIILFYFKKDMSELISVDRLPHTPISWHKIAGNKKQNVDYPPHAEAAKGEELSNGRCQMAKTKAVGAK